MQQLRDSLLQLITETATNLPADVRRALRRAGDLERPDTQSGQALSIIQLNVDMAQQNVLPICQDTGMPTFYVHTPVGVNQIVIRKAIEEMVAEATRRGKLRPNSVDSVTGKNSGLNLGPGTPVIHFEQWEEDEIEVQLILKGGGCENKNIQYSLPAELEHVGRAGRDLEGVYRCILHAVWQAQGQGCSAGFIGVCIGGDRASGYDAAKQQLFRDLDDVNPDPQLAELEARVMENANKLNIGTMGFGNGVTLLGCKIGALNRLPASFFVSVAYNCWAFRRLGVRLDPQTGAILRWQFRDEHPQRLARSEGIPTTGREYRLTAPLSETDVRQLRVGDVVILDGPMYTGRDALHKYLVNHDAPVDLRGAVLYHCGPVMLRDEDGRWHVKAAGPTTSIREEPYQAEILRKFGVRAVIGKGGMGRRTLEALQEVGAVYLNAVGGAAQFYAEKIREVTGVHFLEEFGIPEAMWHLQASGFVAVVTMDSHGNSLHADVERESAGRLEAVLAG
ncbi:MAG: FumA C-terminus/TtdB family hydratase beta subunit [Chloroherpetonaceae bacterium]|nr:fumarate hydratase [Chthonomonadaceae bacterium]MDW8207660.1 FumA C-terminus/TtdB family hydratase beta subunit [Chloroherpetonaceae bacterium]